MRKLVTKYPHYLVFIIIFLIGIVSFIIGLNKKVNNTPINPIVTEMAKTEKQRYEDNKKALQQRIDSQNIKINLLYKKLEVIQQTKTKIRIEYVNKETKISSASATALLVEFDSVFAKNSVK